MFRTSRRFTAIFFFVLQMRMFQVLRQLEPLYVLVPL